VTTVDQFFARLNYVWANVERPGGADIIGALYFVLLGLIIALIQVIAFAVILFSFIALGVGVMLGPFFVVAYLFQATRHWFWNWVNFMLKYALFQVIAAAYVNVIATAGLVFIGAALHGDYSLGHLIAMFVPFLALMVIGVFGLLKVGALTNDLLSGTANAGASGTGAASFIGKAF
jgi:type IV secretion system protein VirB6